MRRLTRRLALGLTILLAAAPARAGSPDLTLGRYAARVIVTGTDMRARPGGLAVCLTDVLVKVSGDPTLADDPRVPALAARASDFVADLDYRDRMSALPHHDEQGSSDRPFDLTVRFVPARVDAALATLGRRPWPDPRPVLLPLIRVQTSVLAYAVTTGEPRADGMRAAWAGSGQRYGLAVALPPAPLPGAASQTSTPDRAVLTGSLTLPDGAPGWVGRWQLAWAGQSYDWGIAGVNFDEAFRDATRGALQILSGHGAPR